MCGMRWKNKKVGEKSMKKAFTVLELVVVMILLTMFGAMIFFTNTNLINFAQIRMTRMLNTSNALITSMAQVAHIANTSKVYTSSTGTTMLWYWDPNTSTLSHINAAYVKNIKTATNFYIVDVDLQQMSNVPLCTDEQGNIGICHEKQTRTATVDQLYIRRFITDYPALIKVDGNKLYFSAPFTDIWDPFNQVWVPCTSGVRTEAVGPNNGTNAYLGTLIGIQDTVIGKDKVCKSMIVSGISQGHYYVLPALKYQNTSTTYAIILQR